METPAWELHGSPAGQPGQSQPIWCLACIEGSPMLLNAPVEQVPVHSWPVEKSSALVWFCLTSALKSRQLDCFPVVSGKRRITCGIFVQQVVAKLFYCFYTQMPLALPHGSHLMPEGKGGVSEAEDSPEPSSSESPALPLPDLQLGPGLMPFVCCKPHGRK
jgi:hypothetical protein